MRKYICLLVLVFAVALTVRFYPTLISGLPFSTDGWSSIRNAELLLRFTPVSLGDNSVFDGYHSYWPGNSLFGAVFSEVTGSAPIDAMAFGVPLAGTLAIPLFFVLVRKVTENTKVALISTALLATVYPYAMFTAGVTKETFANPIYLTLILVFLLGFSWGKMLLFSVASLALVLSHHLTALITLGVMVFLTVAFFYSKSGKIRHSARSNIFLLFLLALITVCYFGFYASEGLTVSLASNDLLSLGAYQLLVLSLVLYFVSKQSLPCRRVMLSSFAVTLVCAVLFALLITKTSLVPSAPVLPLHYLLYISPYLVLLPLMMLGFGDLHKRRIDLLFPVFWLAPLLALECYAIFTNVPMGLTLAYRTLNFLLLPLCILFGVAFYKLYVYSKSVHRSRFLCVGVVATVLVVACMNCYSVFASVSLQERYMGYFWLYRTPEMSASNWLATTDYNQTVAGDMKVSYLLQGYFNMKVNMVQGLQFLEGDGSAPKLLFVYPEMYTNGYVVYSGNVLTLPENWSGRLVSLSCVYANGMVSVHAK